jgi:murein hydrolase activator
VSRLKSLIKVLLWLCVCTSVSFTENTFAAKKIEVAKEDLSDLHEKIETLKKELDSSQEAHKDATDELKQSETAISAANKKLYDIKQKQAKNSNTLSKLKKQSVRINGSLAEQQKQLSAQLYQQYTHGGQSYTQLVLQSKDPSSVARELKYFSYIAKERAKLIDNMEGSLVKVKKLNNETKATLQQVADLKAKQEAEKKELELHKKEKSKVVKNLSQQIAAQRNEISKLKRDEKNLSNLVERLAKIVPPPPKKKHKSKGKSKSKIKHKRQENNQENNPDTIDEAPSENTTVASNETLPSNDFEGVNFASLRGKLRLPVRGDVTNRFGAARQDTGISWKGLFIRAAEGNAVKAVATGRVVFADWMRGFGNLIIVDHGDGYMSLYGNNQALLKSVGDSVSGGDSIASVGNSGGNESNGLYYELRRQSKPFDPMSWSVR